MEPNDISGMSLSYEEGLDEIETFFATPKVEPKLSNVRSSPTVLGQMPPEEQRTEPNMDDDDPFAQMMKDIETIPDEALFGSFDGPPLAAELNFGQSDHQNPYLPGTASIANHDVQLPALQTMSSQTTFNGPVTSTPVNRAPRMSNPNSTGNRSELHAEMRSEEAEASSPIQTSPPHAKFTLPGINTPLNPTSAVVERSDEEIFSLRKLSTPASNKAQATKRDRLSSSPSSDAQRQPKRPKDSSHFPATVIQKSSVMVGSMLSETLTIKLDTQPQQSPGQSTMMDETEKRIADNRESTSSLSSLLSSPPAMSPPATSNNRISTNSNVNSISGQSDPIEQEPSLATNPRTQIAGSEKPKKRKKGPARKKGDTNTASGSVNRIPRNSVGRNDLRDLGISNAQNGGKASPRKTRTQRNSELEAQPNAGAAAKRRHRTNPK